MRLGHADYSRRAAKRLHLVQTLMDLINFVLRVGKDLFRVRLKVKNFRDWNSRAAVSLAKGLNRGILFVLICIWI